VFLSLVIFALIWPALFLDPLLSPDGSLQTNLRPHLPGYLISLVWIAVYLALAIPGLGIVTWLFGRLARCFPRLVCPYCDRGLARSFQRVVATRACPGCEREILVDYVPEETALLSREEADNRRALWQRSRQRELCEVAAFILVIWCAIAFKEEGVIPDGMAGEWVEGVLLGGAVTWMIWVCVRQRRRFKTRIVCPRCGWKHEPPFVAKFGRCGECSQPLVANAPTEPVGVAGEPADG
jgi:hypothetical protein